MSKLCIYHGNCADGFASAWVFRKKYPDANFFPGVYQEAPPDVAGADVFMVDFSYKKPVMESIIAKAASVTVLDHHKTAEADLSDLLAHKRIQGVFDMERSGATITWDELIGGPRPRLLEHIEDRDLWRFALPGTREIQANVFSYPYEFDVWDTLFDADPEALINEGRAIERKHHKDIAELVRVFQRRIRIDEFDVPAASLPYTLTSDAGHLMAQGELFAACYWDTPSGRVFSLRSTDDGIDVSEVAARFGGGGHRNAAGFTVPYDKVNHGSVQSCQA